MPLLAPKALNGLYFFCEPLAEGSFGVLYIAIHVLSRQKVAIKILDKRKLGSETFRVRSEIEALKNLNHKYIYKLYQVVETEHCFYLIFEYLPGGELFDYILQKERLSEVEARVIFRQIVSAIGYVHAKGYAHRDLKPENILLDNDQNVRLIDFGLCARNTPNNMLSTFCGSVAYAAPEVLANKEYAGSAADLWSLGVILYTLLCGCLPFDPTKQSELSQKIGKGQFTVPDSLSKSSRQLLAQLMCVDPRKRIKIDELRRHPWVVDGFMGHSVDLNEEKNSMHLLNMRIVTEISDYTRIPKVEMIRMLQRRSYDYLMATYMIMEAAFEEDNTYIHLHARRRIEHSNAHARPHRVYHQEAIVTCDKTSSTVPTNTASNSGLCVNHSVGDSNDALTMMLHRSPLPPTLVSIDHPHDNHHCAQGPSTLAVKEEDEEVRPADNFVQRADNLSSVTDENLPPRTSGTNIKVTISSGSSHVNVQDHLALSPSRSVDSQLARLSQRMHESHLSETSFRGRPNYLHPDSNSSIPPSLDGRLLVDYSGGSSSASSVLAIRASTSTNPSHTQSSSEQRSGGSLNSGSNWRQLGRIKDVLLTPKKPDARFVSDRLRKARHLNNVFIVRPELTPGQVFERITTTLQEKSIRFTLKGSAFVCVIANDWGKTVLSFELELVYVSARAVETVNSNATGAVSAVKRRMTLKPRQTIQPRPTQPLSDVNISSNQKSQNQVSCDSSQKFNTVESGSQKSKHLGVKIKRIRGDSFMYTGLCRTILDSADIRLVHS